MNSRMVFALVGASVALGVCVIAAAVVWYVTVSELESTLRTLQERTKSELAQKDAELTAKTSVLLEKEKEIRRLKSESTDLRAEVQLLKDQLMDLDEVLSDRAIESPEPPLAASRSLKTDEDWVRYHFEKGLERLPRDERPPASDLFERLLDDVTSLTHDELKYIYRCREKFLFNDLLALRLFAMSQSDIDPDTINVKSHQLDRLIVDTIKSTRLLELKNYREVRELMSDMGVTNPRINHRTFGQYERLIHQMRDGSDGALRICKNIRVMRYAVDRYLADVEEIGPLAVAEQMARERRSRADVAREHETQRALQHSEDVIANIPVDDAERVREIRSKAQDDLLNVTEDDLRFICKTPRHTSAVRYWMVNAIGEYREQDLESEIWSEVIRTANDLLLTDNEDIFSMCWTTFNPNAETKTLGKWRARARKIRTTRNLKVIEEAKSDEILSKLAIDQLNRRRKELR